ncbi:MAG: amino acid adenylation domain-containing protein [Melioribacteraceae bacterium]
MSNFHNRINQLTPEQKAVLEKRLREKALKKASENSIPIRVDLSSFPMTNEQKRLWFLHKLNSNSASYNMPAAVKLRGELNYTALEKSFIELLNRHQIFNVVFDDESNGPKQIIKKKEFSLQIERNISSSLLSLILSEEANKPFNLAEGPLFRIKIINISKDENILLITLHHIIADGWSVEIIITELISFYNVFIKDQNYKSQAPRIQYFDYAEWSNNLISKEKEIEEIEYWKNKLSNMPQVLDFPLDKVRPSFQTFNGNKETIEIPILEHKNIIEIGKEISATPFMTYLALLEILIYKFTNQKDFGVGTVSNGRQYPEVKNLVGFFVNTIVLRSIINDTQTFFEFLENVKKETIESFSHQTLPFEIVVNNVVIEKKVSHSPLFQVMFDYQENPLKKISFSDIKLELLDQNILSSKFDLVFIVQKLEDELTISAEYNTDIFEQKTILSLLQVYKTLISEVVKNRYKSIKNLKLLTNEELVYQTIDFNRTEFKISNESSITKSFKSIVKQNSNRIAVRFYDKKITYKQLDEKSDQIANILLKNNVELGNIVGISVEPSIEMIIGVLGILKAGAVYLPLDPKSPIERLNLMLKNADTKIILYKNKLAPEFELINATKINIDQESQIYLPKINENLNISLSPLNGAYLIFTSGSTGQPKGVICNHQGVINLVNDFHERRKLECGFKQSLWTTLNFDVSVLEIFYSILFGGELCIVPEDERIIGEKLFSWLVSQKIESSYLPPFLLEDFTEWLKNSSRNINLKKLLVGVEPIYFSTLYKINEAIKNIKIINGYGPTETTVYSTAYNYDKLVNPNDIVPIGFPINNTKVYIADNNLNILPKAFIGELYISSIGIAQGYYLKPDQTADKFIPNPFSDNPGDRLYRTGDLVRRLSDGSIKFIGRSDNQVKVRGFRIELSEIESALKKINEIKDVSVIVIGNESKTKKIVAFIVLNANYKLHQNEITNLLQKFLPSYMIPSNYIIISNIPVTLNGKIDKNKLLSQYVEDENNKVKFQEPRTNFEKYLVSLWKEILKVKKVSIHDNFFSLGGNSLQAAIFTNRLQKDIDTDVQVQSIFLAPTIYEFSHFAYEYYRDIITDKFHEKEDSITIEFNIEKTEKLSDEKIEEFRRIVKISSKIKNVTSPKNKEAVFILSPPRSGSTLLRVMLEGHDKLFSPPELDLLTYDSLSERKEKLSKEYNLWLEAAVRAIMELRNCSVNEAEKIMESFENQNMSVKEFYNQLQIWSGERILVDKTPTYAFDINILKKAEEYFENPKYIHLVRHPYASIYSFIEAKLDQNFFRHKHSFSRVELAELIWQTSHDNILNFLDEIPENRKVKVKFEDLVIDSTREMKKISNFLGIEFDEKLVNPYQGKRMTDPTKENSQMVGDFKFYLRNKIDPKVSDRWKNYHKENFLSDKSIDISNKLGYDILNATNFTSDLNSNRNYELTKIPRDQEIPLSYAQQRIWFLDQLDPGKPTYNIPSSVELKGKVNIKLIEKCLNLIIDRHESFRTYFKTENGQSQQCILSHLEFTLEYFELESINQNFNLTLEDYIEQESSKPFNLEIAPLFRIKLIRVAEDHHLLFLNMHHIIADGWSLEIFIKEFSIIYDSLLRNVEPKLEKLEYHYADYSVWQRKILSDEIITKKINYWKKQLSDSPMFLNFPTDFNRPAIQKQRGKRIQFVLNHELTEFLTRFAAKENITLTVLFLTAYKILLHKYSTSNDILIGTPVAGRNKLELQQIIGLFVNTIVLRSKFSNNITVSELLFKVNQTLIEALNNQEVPFEKLVDELKVERSLSHSPLFQAMFVFNNSPISEIELKELKIQPQKVDLKISKFDLNLVITKRNEKLTGVFEYDTDLFKEETIFLMIDHYLEILTSVLTNPSQKISELQFINNSEKIKLLNSLNNTVNLNQNNTVLHKLFEENLTKFACETAVIYKDKKISFSELNRMSNQLSNYLIKKGVLKESIVVVSLERSIENIIAILAIWKAGGIYLPIDPSYPIDRLNYMIENSNATIVITEKSISEFTKIKTTKIILSDEIGLIENENSENPNLKIFSENLAYIIFTSGSTGLPKGVMIQHRTAINLAYGLSKKIYKSENRKFNISLNAPLSFDASMQQIIMLIFGHTLVIIPEEIRLDGNAFIEYINDKQIDILDCVPTQLKILIESGILNNHSNYPQIILPGGEPINTDIWDKIKNTEHIKFFNMYGPTECTVDSTICDINKTLVKPSIGKPIENSIHFILDSNLNLAPKGIPGELYIGGDCISRGYLKNPSLTAERFIPNPYDKNGGSRIYKTGDLVRLMNDGNIEYLGRLDEQVKLRGFRIELGEIETNLRRHELIEDAVVLIREDEPENKKLVAYYIVKPNSEITIGQLKKHLAEKLPEYMVPSLFMEMTSFPLLTNKKINRKGFPRPEFNRDIIDSKFLAPSNEVENSLVTIWKEVLKVENIGVNDNFFELGGDSILAIQVISKANQSGIKITPKNIFQSPTIKGLSLLAGNTIINFENKEIHKGIFSLSPIQNWFFDQSFQNQNHWNQSLLIEFSEPLDKDILRITFSKIFELHDSLRLRFEIVDSKFMQYYSNDINDLPFEIEKTITNNISLDEITNKHQASLNLENGPIAKFVYIKTENKYYLFLVAHHLVIDSVSWRIIFDDIQNFYLQLKQNKKFTLPTKSTSYSYWINSLKKYSETQEFKNQIIFWKNQKEIQSTINEDYLKSEINIENSAKNYSQLVTKELTDLFITEISKSYKAELNELLITIFVKSYSIWKGKRKVSLTLENHGRENLYVEVDLSRTVGWFTSMYPIVLDLKNSISSIESLITIKEQLRKIPQNGISYGIYKLFFNSSDLPHLSAISFNYLGKFNMGIEEQSSFKIVEQNKGLERAKENLRPFELDFVCSIVNDRLHLNIIFNKNLFEEVEIVQFMDTFIQEIKLLINDAKFSDGGYSPSDFKDIELNNEELDSIFNELNEDLENE